MALTVSGDETWQRRGFKSIHGVAAISSFSTTPKVLDVQRLSKTCLICTGLLSVKNINPDLYDEIIHNHDCETNYDGSSGKLGFVDQRTENKSMLNFCVGSMESQGIQDILNRLLRFMFIVNEGTNEIRRKRHNTTKIETYRVNLPLIQKSHCMYIFLNDSEFPNQTSHIMTQGILIKERKKQTNNKSTWYYG